MEEVFLYVKENSIDVIIFDDDLSPSQLKNIEQIFKDKCKILDRSNLILDIFASRVEKLLRLEHRLNLRSTSIFYLD